MTEKILVVDDEIVFVEAIRRILTKRGYEVIAACNGKEALEKVRNENPDLMILDIVMPEINGYEVCKELRQDPLYKHLPIIMLTVKQEKEDKIKGMELGSDEYMAKPFHPKELLLRIKKVLHP